jgi:hypothetical protein
MRDVTHLTLEFRIRTPVMVPVLHIVRGSVAEGLQVVAENIQSNLHSVSGRVATMQRAVAHDMRALWEGAEANFHEASAANEPTEAVNDSSAAEPTVDDGWRLPLGWISLAAGAAAIAGLGLAHIEMRERTEATNQQTQKSRGLSKKAHHGGRSGLSRTDWSSSG